MNQVYQPITKKAFRPARKILAFLFLPAMALFAYDINTDPLPIGAMLPKGEIKLLDVSGKETALKNTTRENGLLVMFSCNTCPVVINNQLRTKTICQYALSKNIGVILLNANEANRRGDESLQAMRDYARVQQYNWFYAIDRNSELADAFGANRTPECFLFNKEGKLVYHGAIDDNPGNAENVSRQHLKEAIDQTISGKEVTVKKSRSVGCNIKRLG